MQNEEDDNGLLFANNASVNTEEHHNSVEVQLTTQPPSSRERSDLSFSYTLRKVFSREPDVDSKEAQPLSYPYKKPEIHYDDPAEHIEVDGRAIAISAAVGEGEATLDGSYSMRKARSCPISPLYEEEQYEEQSKKKKRGMFGKRRVKNALSTMGDDETSLGKKGKKIKKKDSGNDDSTRCNTPDNSYADNSYFLEVELQDNKKKRRFDPWMITLIVLVCFILGTGAFASAHFLPDLLGEAGYEEIVYTPTDISASPSSGDGTSVTFYAMADAPYTDHERENIMPYQINNLSSSADFLIHLGDLQYAGDGCQEYAYQAASDILKQSTIPVFVIPGGKFFVSTTNFSLYIRCYY